jgi:hypothetical protein
MHYVKTADGKWIFDEIEGESGLFSLETVDFQLALSDLYEQVDFVANDSE